MEESRAWSVTHLSRLVNIPTDSVRRILAINLGLRKKRAKWIPHILSDEQRETRINYSKMNLCLLQKDKTLLKRTLTIDESWVSLYSPLTKDMAMQWLLPGKAPKPMASQGLRTPKRMLILAMDCNGIAFWKLCEGDKTVTSEVYQAFLDKYIKEWARKNGVKVPMLLHDNARPHKARQITAYLERQNIRTWNHPPYSPDLMPNDFICFGPLKRRIKGKHYNNWEEVEDAIKHAISEGTQNGLYMGVAKLPERWARVIKKDRYYI